MTEPIRSCIGCGRKGPQREFLRFVAKNGALVFGQGEPGRGAYTCRQLSCFERAVSRRAFNRSLRQTIRVGPELSSLYT
ncbi:hypothetical protein BH18ACT12_BH18ACT12_02200 [soil metagenome]